MPGQLSAGDTAAYAMIFAIGQCAPATRPFAIEAELFVRRRCTVHGSLPRAGWIEEVKTMSPVTGEICRENRTKTESTRHSPEGDIVPQRMRRHSLGNLRRPSGGMNNAGEMARGEMVDRVLSWKQPTPGPFDPPPVTQQLEQLWEEHWEAVLAALCVRKIYVAIVAERQSDSVASPFDGNITFCIRIFGVSLGSR